MSPARMGVLAAPHSGGSRPYSGATWLRFIGRLSMMRAATVVFLVALVLSHARAEPGIAILIDDPINAAPKGFVAVAEVGPPPQDVGEALEAWDRIKR